MTEEGGRRSQSRAAPTHGARKRLRVATKVARARAGEVDEEEIDLRNATATFDCEGALAATKPSFTQAHARRYVAWTESFGVAAGG